MIGLTTFICLLGKVISLLIGLNLSQNRSTFFWKCHGSFFISDVFLELQNDLLVLFDDFVLQLNLQLEHSLLILQIEELCSRCQNFFVDFFKLLDLRRISLHLFGSRGIKRSPRNVDISLIVMVLSFNSQSLTR